MKKKAIVWLLAVVIFLCLAAELVIVYDQNVARIRAYNREHFGITEVDVDPFTLTPGFWALLALGGSLIVSAFFVFERKKALAAVVAIVVVVASSGFAFATRTPYNGSTMLGLYQDEGDGYVLPMKLIFDANTGNHQQLFDNFFNGISGDPRTSFMTFHYNLYAHLNITAIPTGGTYQVMPFWYDQLFYMGEILQNALYLYGCRFDNNTGMYVWDPKPDCLMLCFILGDHATDCRGLSMPDWNAMIVKDSPIGEVTWSVAVHEFGHQLYCVHCDNVCMMSPNAYYHLGGWCDTCLQIVHDHYSKWWH